MEPIAVNHIAIDKTLFAEGHAAIFSKQRQRMMLYCGIVFCVFGLILLAVQVRMPVASMLSFPAILSGVIVVIFALTLQKSELRRKYAAFQRKNGDVSERTVCCYRAYLTIETGDGEPVQIDYPDIRDHRETERLFLLICTDHTGVMLARDGFRTGSWQTLLEAIGKAKQEAEEAAKLMEI